MNFKLRNDKEVNLNFIDAKLPNKCHYGNVLIKI